MAVRDRNLLAWQAYVMVATIVSLILLGSLGWILFTSGTNTKLAQEAQARATKSENDLRTATQKMQSMQFFLGAKQLSAAEVDAIINSIGADEELNRIQQMYKTDMDLFGADVPAQDRNYNKLVSFLMQAVRQRNLAIDSMTKEVAQLRADVASVRREKDEAVAALQATATKLEVELAQARDESKRLLDEHQRKLEALSKDHQQQFAKMESARKKVEAENSKLIAENTSLTKFKRELVRDIQKNVEREDFEAHQGEIIDVDAGGTLVWINLGRRHGLRTGLQFSIMNRDVVRISEGTPKARIEITSVDDTYSQARVLHNRYSVPVIKGDLVYSPTWKLGGGNKQFALLGRMDIDDNGSDDTEVLRTLIEQNGGFVVEITDAYGRNQKFKDPKTGTTGMSIETHYLVRGSDLRLSTSGDPEEGLSDTQRSSAAAFKEMEDRARNYEISVITLDRLVSLLRKLDEDRTIPLGDAIRSSDFVERSPQRYSELTPREKSEYSPSPFRGFGAPDNPGNR